ncbi:outer membrane protein TolC [Hymenobacter luteus]|uniref:Outer membrane protein TolC n=2 Tax=Hymenobacter TaxID=89966 RepID=A0A7W9WBN4_9BACT|nr:outer membrane protein TolC [Hymenobacter latericoloratus]MBB6058610.1 outer membrane protein TolC [Hymenobacter luteus]
MLKRRIYQGLSAAALALAVGACKTPQLTQKAENRAVPVTYTGSTQGSVNTTGKVQWKQFFQDPNLVALIDTARRLQARAAVHYPRIHAVLPGE